MNKTLRNEVAAFRFGLIAPIVQRQLQPGEITWVIKCAAEIGLIFILGVEEDCPAVLNWEGIGILSLVEMKQSYI